jgi:hypothetical protein
VSYESVSRESMYFWVESYKFLDSKSVVKRVWKEARCIYCYYSIEFLSARFLIWWVENCFLSLLLTFWKSYFWVESTQSRIPLKVLYAHQFVDTKQVLTLQNNSVLSWNIWAEHLIICAKHFTDTYNCISFQWNMLNSLQI